MYQFSSTSKAIRQETFKRIMLAFELLVYASGDNSKVLLTLSDS